MLRNQSGNAPAITFQEGREYNVFSLPTAQNQPQNAAPVDLSRMVLAMLNQLVNANKISSDIATTKQVQIVP